MRAELNPMHAAHVTHAPHAAPRAGSMGSATREETYRGKNRPTYPRTVFGPSPTTRCAYVWPRPGAPVGVQKGGYTFCTPMIVHEQSEPRAPPHRARQGR